MENNAFVLLAGGKSQRMRLAKGLLKYKQTYWILEQLNRISKTKTSTIYIGLGYDFEHYLKAIPWLKKAINKTIHYQGLYLNVVINQNPELGSFSTLQTVLKSIEKNQQVLINPIDTPILNSRELNKIIQTNNFVVQPNYNGKNGHPIKLKPEFWTTLLNLNAADNNSRLDFQIKKLYSKQISKVQVKDSAIIQNLNTPTEWKEFLNKTNQTNLL